MKLQALSSAFVLGSSALASPMPPNMTFTQNVHELRALHSGNPLIDWGQLNDKFGEATKQMQWFDNYRSPAAFSVAVGQNHELQQFTQQQTRDLAISITDWDDDTCGDLIKFMDDVLGPATIKYSDEFAGTLPTIKMKKRTRKFVDQYKEAFLDFEMWVRAVLLKFPDAQKEGLAKASELALNKWIETVLAVEDLGSVRFPSGRPPVEMANPL